MKIKNAPFILVIDHSHAGEQYNTVIGFKTEQAARAWLGEFYLCHLADAAITLIAR